MTTTKNTVAATPGDARDPERECCACSSSSHETREKTKKFFKYGLRSFGVVTILPFIILFVPFFLLVSPFFCCGLDDFALTALTPFMILLSIPLLCIIGISVFCITIILKLASIPFCHCKVKFKFVWREMTWIMTKLGFFDF